MYTYMCTGVFRVCFEHSSDMCIYIYIYLYLYISIHACIFLYIYNYICKIYNAYPERDIEKDSLLPINRMSESLVKRTPLLESLWERR